MGGEVLKAMEGKNTLLPVDDLSIVIEAMKKNGFEPIPFETVKTFNGWLHAGRLVSPGQKPFVKIGVTVRKIVAGQLLEYVKPCHLFHISQTDSITN